ncbi:MAG: 2-polyprenyl-3-methyl-5-hydroxy-6-metoxy,4-benzoquinol methylase [Frankiales bacterium]|nr:2-polyprenyl-3-methyl-5-hydroxy-6-metoxy,4-benzoquinol methylase [Frankiales bacterium]
MTHPVRPLNDPGQYDDLRDQWWEPRGGFAMLHWIAEARSRLVPPAVRQGSLLLDLACGGGLLAPHIAGKGHRHVGLDLSPTALPVAREHGVVPVRGDVLHLPFRDEVADVVVAGEVLEHVGEPLDLLTEACRVLRPGGTLVLDTIAATAWGRFSAVTVGERMPAGPPKRLHDPALFVDRRALVEGAARCGVRLELSGLRPSVLDYLAWLAGRKPAVRMITTRSTAGLFQAHGTKETA